MNQLNLNMNWIYNCQESICMNILKCNLLKDQSIEGQLQTDRQTGSFILMLHKYSNKFKAAG